MEEYVKCISLKNSPGGEICPGEIGKIYKIIKEHSKLDWYLEGINYSVSKTRFEPTTKKEYDLQQGIYVEEIEDLSYQEDLIRLLNNIK